MTHRLLLIGTLVVCSASGCGNEPTTTAEDSGVGLRHESVAFNETTPTDTETIRVMITNALRERGRYRRPTTAEFEEARRLFSATLEVDADFDDLHARWETQGMELIPVNDGSERFWVLREAGEEKLGRGITVIRRSDSVSVMLQAPHSFFDVDTDEIALALFLNSRCRVCFWNSVHRRVADLVDEENSLLNALTAAFAETFSNGRTLQLHGFYDDARRPRFGRPIGLIISQGTDEPTSEFLMLAHAVRRECDPFETAVYPLDVRHLGGTLNQQGALLREEGNEHFVHLEMSRTFRSAVLEDIDLQRRLGRALSNLELNPLIN